MAPAPVVLLTALFTGAAAVPAEYQHQDTRELVALVNEAAGLVGAEGEAAFSRFAVAGSRWRRGEMYVFVLDLEGKMQVHPDAALEGRNQLELRDVNGKPIVRGLIAAATAIPGKPEGWYHYEWPVPGGLLPRWKSSYVKRVKAPSGNSWLIGAGMYNDRMERAFVVHLVEDAVAQLERKGEAAFPLFRDPAERFIVKDAYIFVLDGDGAELVNPAFPNLEGRNLLEMKDSRGKPMVREMFELVRTRGSGWVDYHWPRPGESVSTRKSTFVRQAKLGSRTVLVGCGVYLADAPRESVSGRKMTSQGLATLVRQAADVLEKQGERAYPMFRKKGTRWFVDDTYLFVWNMEGVRVFHAASPEGEGEDVRALKDVRGRPIGQTFLEAASSPSGEGWAHYLYPEPGKLFPIWKSTFVKRVTFPSGEEHLVGSGVYGLPMDRSFIQGVVDQAADLVQARGENAFATLRDPTGPFFFMDTYVFVGTPDGVELVNPAQPSLEGKNLLGEQDPKGKYMVREYIEAAMKRGSAWVTYHWYKPGQNTPAPKHTYVRRVQSGKDTFIVGSGYYPE